MRGRVSASRDVSVLAERETSKCDSYRDPSMPILKKARGNVSSAVAASPQCGIKYIEAEIFMFYSSSNMGNITLLSSGAS